MASNLDSLFDSKDSKNVERFKANDFNEHELILTSSDDLEDTFTKLVSGKYDKLIIEKFVTLNFNIYDFVEKSYDLNENLLKRLVRGIKMDAQNKTITKYVYDLIKYNTRDIRTQIEVDQTYYQLSANPFNSPEPSEYMSPSGMNLGIFPSVNALLSSLTITPSTSSANKYSGSDSIPVFNPQKSTLNLFNSKEISLSRKLKIYHEKNQEFKEKVLSVIRANKQQLSNSVYQSNVKYNFYYSHIWERRSN